MRVPPTTPRAESATAIAAAPRAADRSATREVPARKTATSTAEIRAALARAHQTVAGEPATPELLDVLTAHVSHETALGTRMFNYNFGGIKGAGPTGESARYLTHEVTDAGETVRLSQSFRAYGSLEAGATDYLRLMSARFPEAVQEARGGNPDAFAAALKKRGYYTATEASYAAAMRRLVADPAAIGRDGAAVSASAGATSAAAATRATRAARSLASLPPQATSEQMTAASDAAGYSLLTTIALSRVMNSLSDTEARIGAPTDGSSAGPDAAAD